ncbi:MAG: DUF4342 domain-containing protein [Rubrobacteridae bacterium]|nr:DUF4342 domain-containing protein [Rubrobacteridae bacterium]
MEEEKKQESAEAVEVKIPVQEAEKVEAPESVQDTVTETKETVKETAKETAKEIKEAAESSGEKVVQEIKEVFNMGQLKETLSSLAHESTVRRIKLVNREGRIILDLPMWLATAGGASAIVASPGFTILGLIAGIAMGAKLEVERVEDKTGEQNKE